MQFTATSNSLNHTSSPRMNPTVIRVLLIEDDDDDALLIKEYLAEVSNFKFEVTWEPILTRVRPKMLSGDYDIFLIDYLLGVENALDFMKFKKEKGILTPAIILTGKGDLKVDTDASQFGAADYLIKRELDASILERSIRYALTQAKILKELDEKEKKYRSLFERSVDPIFLANEKLKLNNVNNSFLQLLEYSLVDSSNLNIENLFAKREDYDYFRKSLKEFEQIKDFEVALRTKDGKEKICLLNCVFIPDQASEFCCYQGIIHDLTFRKQAENELIQAERLSLTGKIAQTIAHEVRNPLTSLNMALHQLRSEIPTDNESVNLYGNIIERNANRIEQLVNEMLSSSKPKELQLQLTSVNEIVDHTLSLAIDRIKLNRITLHTDFIKDPPRILVDKDKIQIALLNIMINAVEAMEPGNGILTIETLFDNESRVIQISISDNGMGISPTDLGKLFDPFFSKKQRGMGLGLTSTKNILNSHNAIVKVNSQLNKGTTFCIQFKISE